MESIVSIEMQIDCNFEQLMYKRSTCRLYVYFMIIVTQKINNVVSEQSCTCIYVCFCGIDFVFVSTIFSIKF